MDQKICDICQVSKKSSEFRNSQSRACINCDSYKICDECGVKGGVANFRKGRWMCHACYGRKRWLLRYKCWHHRCKSIIKFARRRARRKNLQMSIDVDWVKDRLEQINYRCELSGIPLVLDNQEHINDIHSISLDRIDPSRGYTKDNVRITSSAVNKIKASFSDREFFWICASIIEKYGFVITEKEDKYNDFYE